MDGLHGIPVEYTQVPDIATVLAIASHANRTAAMSDEAGERFVTMVNMYAKARENADNKMDRDMGLVNPALMQLLRSGVTVRLTISADTASKLITAYTNLCNSEELRKGMLDEMKAHLRDNTAPLCFTEYNKILKNAMGELDSNITIITEQINQVPANGGDFGVRTGVAWN